MTAGRRPRLDAQRARATVSRGEFPWTAAAAPGAGTPCEGQYTHGERLQAASPRAAWFGCFHEFGFPGAYKARL